MISLKNKELRTQKSSKLCKTHKIRRPRVCRNGKVKLNMTKAVEYRNFRDSFKRSPVIVAKNTVETRKGR